MKNDPAFNWQIDHQCPQCGAPVTLSESDRLLLCIYCRTKLYLVTDDHFRYCISAKASSFRNIVYMPYWRMKGLSFSVLADGLENRFFDTTLCAIEAHGIPSSLGLRPQAMKLKFASPDMKGQFRKPVLNARTVMESMNQKSASSVHRVFIGEMVSIIYSPMYLKDNMLHDALLDRPVCPVKEEEVDEYLSSNHSQVWQVRFVSTLCPRCGWDLQGEKDALVLTCANCDSAWTCRGDTFEKVAFSVVAHTGSAPHYLPFWRMKPRIEGITLASYADLIRVGNLPKVITDAFEERPLYFWSPAFKVNPTLFLRWSRQMTVSQPLGKTVETLPRTALYPVTLPSREAKESIVITIASLATDKRRLFPCLSDIRIALDETILEYHPFVISRNELIHTKLRISINKNALAFGTQL